MKKYLILIVVMLFATLTAVGQRKTVTDKLQVTNVKNAEVLKTDAKGNVVAGELPEQKTAQEICSKEWSEAGQPIKSLNFDYSVNYDGKHIIAGSEITAITFYLSDISGVITDKDRVVITTDFNFKIALSNDEFSTITESQEYSAGTNDITSDFNLYVKAAYRAPFVDLINDMIKDGNTSFLLHLSLIADVNSADGITGFSFEHVGEDVTTSICDKIQKVNERIDTLPTIKQMVQSVEVYDEYTTPDVRLDSDNLNDTLTQFALRVPKDVATKIVDGYYDIYIKSTEDVQFFNRGYSSEVFYKIGKVYSAGEHNVTDVILSTYTPYFRNIAIKQGAFYILTNRLTTIPTIKIVKKFSVADRLNEPTIYNRSAYVLPTTSEVTEKNGFITSHRILNTRTVDKFIIGSVDDYSGDGLYFDRYGGSNITQGFYVNNADTYFGTGMTYSVMRNKQVLHELALGDLGLIYMYKGASTEYPVLNVNHTVFDYKCFDVNKNRLDVLKVDQNGLATTTAKMSLLYLHPATAPANPQKGMIYFDSADNVLKCYNGTEWKPLY